MNDQSQDPRDAIDSKAGAAEHLPAIIDTAMPAILRAEIDSQIATARQYPRNIHNAIRNITGLATLDDETAAESLYALVRKKKQQGRNAATVQDQENKAIEGPSIRLAEIAAQCWGNCRIEARVVSVNRQEKYVEALGSFHDLETNMMSTATVRRNISTSTGYLFSADMITVTGNAACSIAKRNAILAGIPRGVYRPAYNAARGIVAGTHATLSENREKAIKAFAAYGVTPAQIFDALDLEGEGDIKLDHIAILRAMFASIKNGEATVEEMFAKEKPATGDPDHSPLVKKSDPISTGGGNEVAGNKTEGQTRPADASATENRSAEAAQQDGKTGEKPVTESAAAGTAAHPSGHAAGHQPAAGADSAATGDGSASANQADAGTSKTEGGGSSQPDLLSGAKPPAQDGKGEPATPGRTEGADGPSGMDKPSAPDRLRAYSKALLSIAQGGPPKLGKQSDAWLKANGIFDGADEVKRSSIYTAHLTRITGSGDIEACKAAAEAIIVK